MTWAVALGFLLAIAPIVITPGVSFTLATQRTISGERNAGIVVAAGTGTGIFVHACLASIGLAAFMARIAHGFTIVRIVGGIYLVALGIITLRRRPGRAKRLPWQGNPTYVQALLGNVLNPKAAAVYLTLAPQFLHSGRDVIEPMLLFAGIHVVVMTLWLVGWAELVHKGRRAFLRRRRLIDRVGGSVLVALGLRTAIMN